MHRILVIAEQSQGTLKPATGAAVGFALQVATATGGSFDILVLGSSIQRAAAAAACWGAAEVLVADSPALAEPLADRLAQVIATVAHARDATLVVATSSTFSKDVLPRAAALLDAGMVSDVLGVQVDNGQLTYRRPMFAGNVVATVRLAGPIQVATVRGAAFVAPAMADAPSHLTPVAVDAAALPTFTTVTGREERRTGRPDPTEARIVVSGGRALRTSDDFERIVGGLADVLQGSIGSSRALVDAGITPNSLQIGQTGKVVAPELYLAIGISGAIQHLAGMKDARVIAAINKDGEAPIFDVADYGLVADVYAAVPEMIAKLKS